MDFDGTAQYWHQRKSDNHQLFFEFLGGKTALNWGMTTFSALCKPGTALIETTLTRDPLYKKNFKLHNWPIPAPISDYFSKNEPIAGLY